MSSKRKPSEVKGVWCRQNQKFYWMETGNHSIANTIERIKRTLMQRDLVEYDPYDRLRRGEEPWVLMTLQEAQEKKHEIEVLYLNAHVESIVKAQEEKKAGLTGWK